MNLDSSWDLHKNDNLFWCEKVLNEKDPVLESYHYNEIFDRLSSKNSWGSYEFQKGNYAELDIYKFPLLADSFVLLLHTKSKP